MNERAATAAGSASGAGTSDPGSTSGVSAKRAVLARTSSPSQPANTDPWSSVIARARRSPTRHV